MLAQLNPFKAIKSLEITQVSDNMTMSDSISAIMHDTLKMHDCYCNHESFAVSSSTVPQNGNVCAKTLSQSSYVHNRSNSDNYLLAKRDGTDTS